LWASLIGSTGEFCRKIGRILLGDTKDERLPTRQKRKNNLSGGEWGAETSGLCGSEANKGATGQRHLWERLLFYRNLQYSTET
jgi:hypothetical protein